VRLSGRDGEAGGASARIRDDAGLRPEAATRAAERLALIRLCLRPPFRAAPAAFWCARMLVPSRNAMPNSMPPFWAASSRRSQTPRWPQRLKVCAAIHQGPSSGGMLRHFAPLPCRQMIASIVRRRS
jgi:hypothetical protein